MEKALRKEVLQRQKEGKLTTTSWIQYRAKILVPPPARFSASQGWVYKFMKRRGLSLKTVSNTNKLSKDEITTILLNWHTKLRSFIRNSGTGQFGAFPALRRWNLDEVGICLGQERIRTVVEKGSRCVWMPRGQGGKMRRYATLVVLVRAANPQYQKLIVILQGKGGGGVMRRAEEWDRSCHVLWQRNAWCDSTTFEAIIRLLPVGEGSLLFLDNLSAHRLGKADMEARGVVPYFGPAKTTDYWQPVDCGVGTTTMVSLVGKWLKGRVYDRLLQADQQHQMDAASKRILFLKVTIS